jgi:hypothetical protein
MKKKIKTIRKTYQTVFSFKIQGEMSADDIIVPPPAIVPPVPPLLPFPNNPESPFSPGGMSPLSPLPVTPPVYYQPKTWKKVIHRYARDYGWSGWNSNYGMTYGVDGMDRYNAFKAARLADGYTLPTAAHPGDMVVEEVVLGYYPTDEFTPQSISSFSYIVLWDAYGVKEGINYSGFSAQEFQDFFVGTGAASWYPFIMKYESWSLFFSSDPADSFVG